LIFFFHRQGVKHLLNSDCIPVHLRASILENVSKNFARELQEMMDADYEEAQRLAVVQDDVHHHNPITTTTISSPILRMSHRQVFFTCRILTQCFCKNSNTKPTKQVEHGPKGPASLLLLLYTIKTLFLLPDGFIWFHIGPTHPLLLLSRAAAAAACDSSPPQAPASQAAPAAAKSRQQW
jgi:hypothetical protein